MIYHKTEVNMNRPQLKELVNKYQLTIRIIDQKEYLCSLYNDFDSETMNILKTKEQELINYIKEQAKIDESKRNMSCITKLYKALKCQAALREIGCEYINEIGDDNYETITQKIEENKKLYPEDAQRSKIYQYIKDQSYEMAIKYDDLYFYVIADKYIDELAQTPITKLEPLQNKFIAEMTNYYMFKHSKHYQI